LSTGTRSECARLCTEPYRCPPRTSPTGTCRMRPLLATRHLFLRFACVAFSRFTCPCSKVIVTSPPEDGEDVCPRGARRRTAAAWRLAQRSDAFQGKYCEHSREDMSASKQLAARSQRRWYSERFVGSSCYSEEARVCAKMSKMKPYSRYTISKRNINNIDKVAFAVHLKSTKIAVCVSVRKRKFSQLPDA